MCVDVREEILNVLPPEPTANVCVDAVKPPKTSKSSRKRTYSSYLVQNIKLPCVIGFMGLRLKPTNHI